ncbi:MAG: histidine kinase dimerization/phospho-acceptor domain-containing protein [Desulfobacterales bacterium]
MTLPAEIVGAAGLEFFGRISASISHEIRNALAVINEHAGLLEDMTLMAEKGMPLDAARLKRTAGAVLKQVQRVDGIVKTMNRFAHSVDEPLKGVDLAETLELVVRLFGRFAAVRQVSLAPESPLASVSVATRPFQLQNLIGLCLDYAMQSAGSGGTVKLSIAPLPEGGAEIRFAGLGVSALTATPLAGETLQALLGATQTGVAIRAEIGELGLRLPPKIACDECGKAEA